MSQKSSPFAWMRLSQDKSWENGQIVEINLFPHGTWMMDVIFVEVRLESPHLWRNFNLVLGGLLFVE